MLEVLEFFLLVVLLLRVVLVFSLVHTLSIAVVSSLDALLLMVDMRLGEMVVALSLRGTMDDVFPLVVLVVLR